MDVRYLARETIYGRTARPDDHTADDVCDTSNCSLQPSSRFSSVVICGIICLPDRISAADLCGQEIGITKLFYCDPIVKLGCVKL